jgi:ammonia channel protein AmtB
MFCWLIEWITNNGRILMRLLFHDFGGCHLAMITSISMGLCDDHLLQKRYSANQKQSMGSLNVIN